MSKHTAGKLPRRLDGDGHYIFSDKPLSTGGYPSVAETESPELTKALVHRYNCHEDLEKRQIILLKFFKELFAQAWEDGGGDIDGGWFQDKAEEMGLIVDHKLTKSDLGGDEFSDARYLGCEEGDSWYLMADWLKAAIAKADRGEQGVCARCGKPTVKLYGKDFCQDCDKDVISK